MKKLIFFFLLVPLFSFAQKGWYLKAGSGYSFKGLMHQELVLKTITPSPNSLDPAAGTLEDMVNRIDSSGQASYVHDTYSKGFNYFVAGGYCINERWFVELGLLWLQGGNINSKSVYNTIPLLGNNATIKGTTNARGLAFSPSVGTNIPLKSGFYLQGRVGLSIPLFGHINHQVDIDAPASAIGTTTAVVNAKTTSRFSLGFHGALGLHKKIGKHLDLFLEMNAQHLNLNGKKMVITRYELNTNGTVNDMLATYPGTYHSEVNFVKELNGESNNTFSGKPIDESRPKDDLQVSIPFSSIGFAVGIMYTFHK